MDRRHHPADGVVRKPLLIGLLVDVSGSMAKKVSSRSDSGTRLEMLQRSIDDLVIQARQYCDSTGEDPATSFHLFCLGFGLGNLLSRALGRDVPPVRNLFALGADSDVVIDARELLDNWGTYRSNIAALTSDMLGATPMVEAFTRAESIIGASYSPERFRDSPILFVVSDGLPTDPADGGPAIVREAASRLRASGVVIVSCYVTATDVVGSKVLYGNPRREWDAAARLMFDCASSLSSYPIFRSHLAEYEWQVEDDARLFAQINQSDYLSEFMQLVVSPIDKPDQPEPLSAGGNTQTPDGVRVFISYCHADRKYVDDSPKSLRSYIRGLEHEGISLWWDQRLNAGDLWDSEIKTQLTSADVVLVLVSQAFLNSEYVRNVEIRAFLEARRTRGMRIIPVILSACDWARHEWLANTQTLPSDGKNLEEHYSTAGKRNSLYRTVLRQLRAAADDVRHHRGQIGTKS